MAKKSAKKAKAKTPRKVARTVTRKAPKRAVKKPVRKAPKAAPARKALKTKASPKKTTKKVVRKPVAKRRARAVPKPKSLARRAVKAPPKKAVKPAKPRAAAKPKAPTKPTAPPKPKPKASPKAKLALPPVPTRLMRDRKRLPEVELEDAFVGTGDDARLLQAARSGHDEQLSELHKRNVSGLELTAGDVDANWEDAYAIGDEAPGGDSPTPDQDRVDDIGKALGVQYDDDEELMGGAEIEERDAHRWELDPKSKNKDEI